MVVRTAFIFFFAFIFFHLTIKGQTNSFYIDSASTCYFADDAIYYHFSNGMIKSDYAGNIIWTKHIDILPTVNSLPDFTFANNAFYGHTDSSVYKIDTAGNTIWIRHLANMVNPVPGATQFLSHVTTDGKRVYVGGGEQTTNSYYKIQVTLDTAGNMINAWSTTIIDPRPDFAIGGTKILPANGAWIANIHYNGITSAFSVFKVDSTGSINSIDSTVVNGASEGVAISGISQVPDSNYIITATHGIVNGLETVSITKFNNNGHVMWTHTLGSSWMFSNLSLCEAIATATDSSNAIYFLGRFMDSSTSLYERPLILKFDSTGNLIWSKSWSDGLLSSSPFSISKMQFHNGMIYSFGNTGGRASVMVFDTSFNNLCYSPDTTFSFFINNFGAGSTASFQNTAFPYTPNTIQPIPSILLLNQPSSIFCALSSIPYVNEEEGINCFPNPFIDEFTIITKESTAGKMSIVLTDLPGKIILKKDFSEVDAQKMHVTTSDLANGIYILQIYFNNKIYIKRIVK